MAIDCGCKEKVVAPKQGVTKIHKEECTQCFANWDSPDGINICLTCYNGACRSHAELHYQKSGGQCPIVMNLRRIHKAKPKEEGEKEPKDLTELMIGGEGGAPLGEQHTTDYEMKVICLKCGGMELTMTGKFEEIGKMIIEASDANLEQQAEVWKLDVETCPCTRSLVQDTGVPPRKPEDLAKCQQCDKTEGLWLCMTCGAVNCGRRVWDGSGGNEHAIAHYKDTGHPLVVKIGTITPDGNADVYCYKCDDEKKFPGKNDPCKPEKDLADYMAALGINVSTQEKTAKSTKEMELELNKFFDWSGATEGDKKLKLVYGPGRTGLKNLGNSCYLSSIVQSMFSIPSFVERYYKQGEAHIRDCQRSEPAKCFHCQMAKLAHGLESGVYSVPRKSLVEKTAEAGTETKQEKDCKEMTDDDAGEESGEAKQVEQEGIPLRMFKALIAGEHQDFRSGRQQDAHEYFTHLIDKVQTEEKNARGGVDPTKIFNFKLETRMECTVCKRVGYKSEKEQFISVPIPFDKEAVKRDEARFSEMEAKAQAEAEKKKEQAASSSSSSSSTPSPVTDKDGDTNMSSESSSSSKDDADEQAKKKRKIEEAKPSEALMKSLSECPPVPFDQCLERLTGVEAMDGVRCKTCGKNTTMHKTVRFNTFPDTLVIQLQRFQIFDYVVQAKLRFDVLAPEQLDLESFTAKGPQDGEQLQPDKAEAFVPNDGMLRQLMDMGFSKNRCSHALKAVKNAGTAPATEWLFANMDNMQYEQPLAAEPSSSGPSVDEGLFGTLCAFGFGADHVKYALIKFKNNMEQAANWLTDHAFEPLPAADNAGAAGDKKEEDVVVDPRPPKYELSAFVTHLGKSTSRGHYIAHVKKDGKWILFNDQKVAISEEPPINQAYMLFYRKVDQS